MILQVKYLKQVSTACFSSRDMVLWFIVKARLVRKQWLTTIGRYHFVENEEK
jgi:hypothetical protein